MPRQIFTIGHSNRTIGAFIGLLRQHGITLLADVRKMPRSRYNPQFNSDALAASLAEAGIAYQHFPAMGGMRPKKPGSVNMGLRSLSFRAYADYMQTAEFIAALDGFLALAGDRHAALMCAESVPWRCHRGMIADSVLARGIAVTDIISPTQAPAHVLREWVRIEHGVITYPAQPGDQLQML